MFNWYPGQTLASIEREAITQALRHYHGNNASVARALGVSERTIYERIQEYKLQDEVRDLRNKDKTSEQAIYLQLQRGQITGAEYRRRAGLEELESEHLPEGSRFHGFPITKSEDESIAELEREIPTPEAQHHG